MVDASWYSRIEFHTLVYSSDIFSCMHYTSMGTLSFAHWHALLSNFFHNFAYNMRGGYLILAKRSFQNTHCFGYTVLTLEVSFQYFSTLIMCKLTYFGSRKYKVTVLPIVYLKYLICKKEVFWKKIFHMFYDQKN